MSAENRWVLFLLPVQSPASECSKRTPPFPYFYPQNKRKDYSELSGSGHVATAMLRH